MGVSVPENDTVTLALGVWLTVGDTVGGRVGDGDPDCVVVPVTLGVHDADAVNEPLLVAVLVNVGLTL